MASRRYHRAGVTPCILVISLAFVLPLGCVYTSEIRTNLDKEDDAASGTDGVDKAGASSDGGAIVGSETEIAQSLCPSDNLTRPCFCRINDSRFTGRQTCDHSVGWSDCECIVPKIDSNSYKGEVKEPTMNKAVAEFNWEKTLPLSSGNCKAGYYAGVFSGFYNSPAMDAYDASSSPSPVGIPVIGTVEFDLHQISDSEIFEVRHGAMEGFALLVIPFRGELAGTVNCEGDQPLMEIGLKNGVYSVFDTNYYFDGKAVSLYNKKTASFSSGEWAVTEPTDYTVVIRDEDGTVDLSDAVFAPLPELIPGMLAIIDTIVDGGAGEWDAFWIGPTTDDDSSATIPEQDEDTPGEEKYIDY